VIRSMPAEQYHADPCAQPSLSCSVAQILLTQSPRHAWLAHPKLNPEYREEEDSRFDLGAAAHAMLLEGDNSRIVWVDADDWRTRAAREHRDAAREAGALPLLTKYEPVLSAMVREAQAYVASSELGDILTTGAAERVILWEESGTHCRARLDLLSSDQHIILDYKTSASARPEDFIRQIGRMQYDLQCEWYCRAVKAAAGSDPVFVFLVQEIELPFSCSLVGLSNAYKEIGKGKTERAIRLWSHCLETGSWPAYTNRICYAEPPAWELQQIEGDNNDAVP
jgi:hypothetical protein